VRRAGPGPRRTAALSRRGPRGTAARWALPLAGLAALLAGCGGGSSGSAGPATTTAASGTPAAHRPPPMLGAHRAPREPVPILMYHVINAPPPGTAQPELWVSRRDFVGEVSWLAGHGYHAVKLQQVWDAWHRGGLLPRRPIVLSFDDGYHSDLVNAMPVLREHGWPGVLNLQVSQTREDLKPPAVRALIRAGWEIDSHTLTHPDLTTVDAARLRDEVAGSRQVLRRKYGVPVDFFCYPAGRFDARVIAAVRAAGYLGATTTLEGLASPRESPYQLRRIRINGSAGVAGLAAALRAAGAGT
jgi:peptidoglycan/xylan/chitin deacetylase (PgdA/CDA1 family)